MRGLSSYRVAVAAVGCVLGAGFLSGQELWQFFGSFGVWGLLGVALSAFLFFLVCAALLCFARDSGKNTLSEIVVFFPSRVARVAVAVFEGAFLFLLYLLMVAAAGALFEQVFGGGGWIGAVCFAVGVATLSYFGVEGLLRVLSLLVPVLTLMAAGVAALVLVRSGMPTLPAGTGGGQFALFAPLYVIFNVTSSVPVLAPVGVGARDEGSIWRGLFAAAFALGGLATLIVLSLFVHPAAAAGELPMLTLAASVGSAVGGVYALLLFGGIFATGLCAMSGLYRAVTLHRPRARWALPPACAAAAFLLSRSGFRQLVGVIYPVFGYLGILPMALSGVHIWRFYRQDHDRANEVHPPRQK